MVDGDSPWDYMSEKEKNKRINDSAKEFNNAVERAGLPKRLEGYKFSSVSSEGYGIAEIDGFGVGELNRLGFVKIEYQSLFYKKPDLNEIVSCLNLSNYLKKEGCSNLVEIPPRGLIKSIMDSIKPRNKNEIALLETIISKL